MRIVIVEDEAPIREGLAKILHKINPDYELVGKAGDGKAGYDLIRRMEPDLVILDIQMPKMDGLSIILPGSGIMISPYLYGVLTSSYV